MLYDWKKVTDPLEFQTVWVAQTRTSSFDTDKGQDPSFSSAVKVLDYPKLKPSLTDLLGQHSSVLAFPGEPLGVTGRAVHHKRLKPDTKPV